jgi:hypothetical protein
VCSGHLFISAVVRKGVLSMGDGEWIALSLWFGISLIITTTISMLFYKMQHGIWAWIHTNIGYFEKLGVCSPVRAGDPEENFREKELCGSVKSMNLCVCVCCGLCYFTCRKITNHEQQALSPPVAWAN